VGRFSILKRFSYSTWFCDIWKCKYAGRRVNFGRKSCISSQQRSPIQSNIIQYLTNLLRCNLPREYEFMNVTKLIRTVQQHLHQGGFPNILNGWTHFAVICVDFSQPGLEQFRFKMWNGAIK